MIEIMMSAMVIVLGLAYFGVFKGKEIIKLKRECSIPNAVLPPKGEMKGGIKFLPPVWEEESMEEMEARVLSSLYAEGVKAWPKMKSPRWVYLPKLKEIPAPVKFGEVPAPVILPSL